jgi:hypothetical protein
MRTLDVAGLVSEPTSRIRFTTAAEVGPTAPTPSPSSTALGVSFAYSGGTAGTYAIGTREYSLHLTGSTPSYVPFTETVYDRRTTTNASGAALTPKTSYTVTFRYTASSPGVGTSTVSATISTASEVKNSAPTVTINSQTTTNVTFTRGTSSGGTYGVSYYEYVIHNSDAVAVSTGTMSTATTSLNISAGVDPNATFRVYVRAISLTSGAAGSYGYADGQLNPNTPGGPTIAFTGMTSSTTGTATMTITRTTYATRVVVNVSGGGASANYDSLYDTANFVDYGTYWTFTVGDQLYNQKYTYKAYVKNRIGSDSVFSNSIIWNTPKKNQYWTNAQDATVQYVFNTQTQQSGCYDVRTLRYTMPTVPATDNSVGYISVSTIGAQFASNGYLANSSYFKFRTPTGVNYSIGSNLGVAYPTFEVHYAGITAVAGSDISNGTFYVYSTAGATQTSSCGLTNYNWFYGRNFYLEGIQTSPGSGTGF